MKKLKLFIDGDAIIAERPSGIGTATVSTIRALSEDDEFVSHFDIYIIIAANKVHRIKRWSFNRNVTVKVSILPGRIFNGFLKYNLLPPMDIFFGNGVYLFPNFRNWPLLRSPSLTYIHDVSFMIYPEHVEPKNLKMLQGNVDKWMRRTAKVITVSKHAKSEITKNFSIAPSKIEVVYNGVDASFKLLSKKDVQPTLDRYGMKYKTYFMFLSNLEPRKNLHGVLSAYKAFCDSRGKDGVSLLLVGGMAWGDDKIGKEIDSLRRHGYAIVQPDRYVPDEDLPVLLSGAAALVHPAFYEGFGISPLQAMACGTQVVVARTSSLPEVVGDAGIYVDPEDVETIKHGMLQAYDKRNEINQKGIKRAESFLWRKSVRKLAGIIEKVAGI